MRSRKGAGELASFALTIPILILVLLAIVQMGMLVYANQMAEEAARHGVRMGSVAQVNQAGVAASAAYSFAMTALPTGHPRVEILAPGGVVGSLIRIRVGYTVPNFLGSLVPGLPPQFTCWGEATMRQEGW